MKPISVKTWRRLLVTIFVVVLVLCVSIAVVFGMRVFAKTPEIHRNRDVSDYAHFLAEWEINDWQTREVEEGAAMIQMNLEVAVDGGNQAELRLINPPYSAYAYEMTLQLVEETSPLYQSKRLNPGYAEQCAPLEANLPAGGHDAMAYFQFFDAEGINKGDYQMEVKLIKTT